MLLSKYFDTHFYKLFWILFVPSIVNSVVSFLAGCGLLFIYLELSILIPFFRKRKISTLILVVFFHFTLMISFALMAYNQSGGV